MQEVGPGVMCAGGGARSHACRGWGQESCVQEVGTRNHACRGWGQESCVQGVGQSHASRGWGQARAMHAGGGARSHVCRGWARSHVCRGWGQESCVQGVGPGVMCAGGGPGVMCAGGGARSHPSKNELARSCKIVQESCKKRDISCARAMQVLHARFLHTLARILHDLASSFLLGCVQGVGPGVMCAGGGAEPCVQGVGQESCV